MKDLEKVREEYGARLQTIPAVYDRRKMRGVVTRLVRLEKTRTREEEAKENVDRIRFYTAETKRATREADIKIVGKELGHCKKEKKGCLYCEALQDIIHALRSQRSEEDKEK